jgi:ABC-2 type transport system permease protein
MKKIRKFWAVVRVAAQAKTAYWHDVGARGLFFAVILFIFTRLWGALLGPGGTLQGFSGGALVWYLTIAEVIMLSSTSLLRQVESDIKSGQVAYLLVRPVNYVLYQASYYLGEMLVSIAMNLVVGGAVAWILAGPPPANAVTFGQTLVLFLIAIAMQFSFTMMIGLLAFFTEECRPFWWIYSKLLFTLGGLFMPIDIYPKVFRQIAEAMPFRSVTYGPARVFVGGSTALFVNLTWTGLAWIIGLGFLIAWEYKKGVKMVHANGG